MVTPLSPQRRGKASHWSPQTYINTLVGSCILSLAFLAGYLFSESSHYDVPPVESNLRGSQLPVGSVPILPGDIIEDFIDFNTQREEFLRSDIPDQDPVEKEVEDIEDKEEGEDEQEEDEAKDEDAEYEEEGEEEDEGEEEEGDAEELENVDPEGVEELEEETNIELDERVYIPEKELFTPDEKRHVWGKQPKRPDDWQTWGFNDIHHGLKCGEHADDMDKPLPDMDYWNFVRDKYKEVVNSEAKFDDPILPTDGYTMKNGDRQLYYAKKSPGKGRGLFASRDIKKGELVHDGRASDIVMTADEWRSMIFALPQKMACDLSEWSWTQRQKKDGPYKLFTAYNISILMNGSNKPNTMPKCSHCSKMYAIRDIKKDEEILTDYKIYPTLWDEVGL